MKNNQSSGGIAKRMLAMSIAIAFVATLMTPLISGGTAPIITEAGNGSGISAPTACGSGKPEPISVAGSSGVIPSPETIVIQPNGTYGMDAPIESVVPDFNMGTYTQMAVGNATSGSGDPCHGIVQFNITPRTATLLSATLSLYTEFTNNTLYGVNCTVYPVTNAWVESEVTWNNRTASNAWNSPGGDYNASYLSYQNVSVLNAWYNWNVTSIVNLWLSGTMINNGFIVCGTPLDIPFNYVRFYTCEYTTNTNYTPKLTLFYSTEIDSPLSAVTMQEDDPMLVIPLDGRGDGTVTHDSITPIVGNGVNSPFWGSFTTQLHDQFLYTSDQVGPDGCIRRISFNRQGVWIGDTGRFDNFNIKMAHTNLTTLTDTFANNYYGYLIEVFPTQTVYVNSSNGDSWLDFNLNDNFTYDSSYNLLVDISWNGCNGYTVPVDLNQTFLSRQLLDITGVALTGSINNNLARIKFWTDVVDNAVIDAGKDGNFFPFTASQPQMRLQLLYNKTFINQSGIIDTLEFQAWNAGFRLATFNNLSIRLAHSRNDTLDTSFEMHYVGSWTEVLNKTSYNVSTVGRPEWIKIDIDNTFNYNGVDNLLIDFRWTNSSGNDVAVLNNQTFSYDCRAVAFNYSAITATQTNPYLYNLRAIFLDSANLTWSATSSNLTLFTVAVSGRNIQITPVANMFGAGTIHLMLTNSNGLGVVQDVPLTIAPVNDAPVLTGVPTAITCVEDVNYVLNMTPYASDIDNDVSTLTYTTNSTFASVNGSLITFNYPEGITSQSVNITVHDAPGLTASAIVAVTIIPVNDAPRLTNFDTLLTCDATVAKSILVNPTDEETPTANLTISVSSSYANVTNHTITFLYPKGIGSEAVTVTVHDEQIYGVANSTSYILSVTILDHPDVVSYNPTGDTVPVDSYIVVEFDLAMNTTETEASFSLKLGATAINGTFAWTSNNTRLTFMPEDHLTNGLYDARIGSGARSAAGITILAPFAWNFTAALGSFDGDGDQIPDQYELDNGLDPNVNDAQSDKDGDGMPNKYEYDNQLNPQVNDAEADADDDGYTNLEEYDAGTNPQDPADHPFSFMLILIIIVIVVVVALLALVLLMKRKPKPSEGVEEFYPQPETSQQPPAPPGPEQGPPQP